MTIATRAYARAGLVGNPSDQYFGKIIAVSVKNFSARVFLEESTDLRIEPPVSDKDVYKNAVEFLERLNLYGYYGGSRLIKAAAKVFFDYCRSKNIETEPKGFRLRYECDIPRQVGLAGSSAIILAAIRALMAYYRVKIPQETQPTLVLNAELKELGINAGYMDRVIQVLEGCVYMDLARSLIESRGYGAYERLEATILPPLYVAYQPTLGKVSGAVHSELRSAYDKGDPRVIRTMEEIISLAEKAKKGYDGRDFSRWPELIDRNFDLRSRIMTISPENIEMVRAARRCGASANFAGSGGSIVGICDNENMFDRLSTELGKLGAKVIRPQVV